MRLLAYGGTGYYERQLIGAWENAPRDALDDSFRLEEEQLTFGLCLIDKEPVLVVRQLQVTKTGRAYAYSLLLDPGASVWDRFEWDAAALADSLFDEATEISRLLLEHPEKLNAQDLQNVLDGLKRKEALSSGGSTSGTVNDYEAAWIGAFFTPSISSWPPKVFGFETRPDFADISKLLWRLPPCFRAGLGWLIGSSGKSGRNFGAQFAIDDKAEVEAGAADELVSRGREIHEALRTLSNDDDFADLAEQLRKKPAWDWADDVDKNSGQIAERLAMIAALLRPTDASAALLQSAVESLPQTDFLDIELRRAWHRAAFSQMKKLTPEQTSFALQNHFDFSLPLRQSDVELLSEDRLAEKFIDEGLVPSSPDVLHLPLAARHKVWLALLRTSAYEDVPGIFFSAVEDLREESESETYINSLYQMVYSRMMKDKSFSLLHWRRYANKPLWPSVQPLLSEVALRRAQSGSDGWQLEYLFFGEDGGAREILQLGLPTGRLKGMIKFFIEAVETHQECEAQARRWLSALADSDLRTMGLISCEDKLRIADAVRGSWVHYLDLWDAYNNRVEFFKPWKLPSSDEREILLKELDELIEKKPARDFVPDVDGLEMLLGALPQKIMAHFQGMTPNFSKPRDISKWVSMLRPRDPKRASKETVRYILDYDEELFTDYWLTPEFEEKEMERLFTTLMFLPHPTRDKRYQSRLRELLTKARGNRRVLNVVRRVFKEGIEKEGTAKIFCKRFANDRNGLEALLGYLSKTTTGIALTDALYKYDADHFVDEAREVWRTARNSQGALTHYEFSFLYNLSKRRGARVKVERSLEDIHGHPVELELDEILQRGVQAGDFQDQPDEPEEVVEEIKETKHQREAHSDEDEGDSFFARVMSYIGFGVAKKEREGSVGNSSVRRGESFSGSAADDTSRQKDEELPDEPNPRDL